jgi:hypothetical protein
VQVLCSDGTRRVEKSIALEVGYIQYKFVHFFILLREAFRKCLLVEGSVTSVVATLSGEVLSVAEVVDLSEQNLQHSVRNTWGVTRQLMAGKMSSVEGQTTLRGPNTLVTSASKCATVVLRVVRDVDVSARVLGEALDAVPGHVLDGEQCSVGGKKHV